MTPLTTLLLSAGSGVVHLTGGTVAFVASSTLGPRVGRFHDITGNVFEKPKTIPGHSMALQLMGTFILWLGWYVVLRHVVLKETHGLGAGTVSTLALPFC